MRLVDAAVFDFRFQARQLMRMPGYIFAAGLTKSPQDEPEPGPAGPDQTIVGQPPHAFVQQGGALTAEPGPSPRAMAAGDRALRRAPPNPAGRPKPTPPAGGARLRAAPSGAGRGRATPLGDANGSRWGSRRFLPANPQHPPRGPQQRQPACRPRIEGGEPLRARSRRRHLGDHSRQAQASFLVPYHRLRSADDEGQPGDAAHLIAKAAVQKVQWLAAGSRNMLPQFDPRQLPADRARRGSRP